MAPPFFDVVKAFFEQQGWPLARSSDGQLINSRFEGRNGRWGVWLKLDESRQTVAVYSLSPVSCPRPLNAEVSEFLTRANFNLPLGNFELDWDDGEIRFKTSLDVEGSQLTVSLLGRLVLTNVAAMDLYLPGLLAVLEKGTPPRDALALCEGS